MWLTEFLIQEKSADTSMGGWMHGLENEVRINPRIIFLSQV